MDSASTTRPVTDARFLNVLTVIADQVVDQTNPSRNGEVWVGTYRHRETGTPWEDYLPEEITPSEWVADQVTAALTAPADRADEIRAMIAARARLGENVRLIEDIDTADMRCRHEQDFSVDGDRICTLLDFVDEIRQLAKDI